MFGRARFVANRFGFGDLFINVIDKVGFKLTFGNFLVLVAVFYKRLAAIDAFKMRPDSVCDARRGGFGNTRVRVPMLAYIIAVGICIAVRIRAGSRKSRDGQRENKCNER